MSRNLGGSVGIALLATILTKREHFHSALINEALSRYSPETQTRLDQMTQSFLAQGADAVSAASQALKGLDLIVRRESYLMAYNDCFLIMGSILLGSILLVWMSGKVLAPSARKPS
jgi:DHA2 family multidrug resistance protein